MILFSESGTKEDRVLFPVLQIGEILLFLVSVHALQQDYSKTVLICSHRRVLTCIQVHVLEDLVHESLSKLFQVQMYLCETKFHVLSQVHLKGTSKPQIIGE